MRTMEKKLMTIAIGIGMGISFTAAAGQCCERIVQASLFFFKKNAETLALKLAGVLAT